jgi:hypothetical protein
MLNSAFFKIGRLVPALLLSQLLLIGANIQTNLFNLSSVEYQESNSNIQVVIARYNEPLDHLMWITEYPHLIYNRGESIDVSRPDPKFPLQVVDLTLYANCGREPYIYISHIIHHYNRLADITIFSRAHHKNDDENDIYTNAKFKIDVVGFADKSIEFTPENDGFMYLIPKCIPLDDFLGQKVNQYNKKYGTDQFDVLWDGYNDILSFNSDKRRFSPVGHFAVTKEAVLRRSREFYISLAKTLSHEADPAVGHFYRRAWWAVFQSTCTSGEDYHCHYDPKVNC